ncbi:glycosyl hydrolase family 71-domain-containing protein [Aspergillus filifer]
MAPFLVVVTVILLACRVQLQVHAAAVFAHFMVTNSANYTSDDWENDIQLAQDAHIDAFALNMAYADPTNTDALAAGAHSSYYFYKGQAFISTFEGPGRADDWPEIKAASGCFFIPSWSSLGAKPAVATGVVDGLFSWADWPWGSQDMNTAPPDLPTDLSDLQFAIFLRKPADSIDSWTWSGYLLPTYYDEEYVCNSAYEVVTSTDHIPDQTDEDSDYGYPIYRGPFSAQDLNCGYISEGLTPGDLHCG